jgi:hypothetical protein
MKLSSKLNTDTTITLNSSVSYKELSSYQYLHWNSAHFRSSKRAVIKGELSRRIKLSTPESWKNTGDDLKTKLLKRRYPYNEIESAITSRDFIKRRELLNRTCAKITRKRKSLINPFITSIHTNIPRQQTIPFVVRYDPRSHRYIKQIRSWMENKIREKTSREGWDLRIVIAFNNDRKSKLLSMISRKPLPKVAHKRSKSLDPVWGDSFLPSLQKGVSLSPSSPDPDESLVGISTGPPDIASSSGSNTPPTPETPGGDPTETTTVLSPCGESPMPDLTGTGSSSIEKSPRFVGDITATPDVEGSEGALTEMMSIAIWLRS